MKKRSGKVVGMTLSDQASSGIVVRLQLPDGSTEECAVALPADGNDTEEERAKWRKALSAALASDEEIEIFVDEATT